MQENKVDYHIHTTFSDGESTPTEIIRAAKELGYDEIAITDHDNVGGLEEARIAGEAVGLRVIPGIELATVTEKGIGLHILGYRIDTKSEELKEFLSWLIQAREDRNERLLAVLRNMGYDIAMDEVELGQNSFLGKPNIARTLVKKGYIADERETFSERILGSPACRAVKKDKPLAPEAIRVIRGAGGTPVLAHPIQTRNIGDAGSEEFYKNIEEIIADLKKQGLKGLECYHPDQNEEQSLRFVDMAEKYHLHITRGTDFHGSDYAEACRTGVYR